MSEFKSAALFEQIKSGLEAMPEAEKKATIKKTNGIFQITVKNKEGKEESYTIDLKKEGKVTKGDGPKPDVSIALADDTFIGLADGKVNAQKAFMTGQLKVKGNVMLATKLDTVLKAAKPKL